MEINRRRLIRSRVIRTISEVLIFAFIAVICTLASGHERGLIRLPTLTEHLEDPPRLFECMKNEIIAQTENKIVPRSFIGPFLSVNPSTGVTDRKRAEYYLMKDPSGDMRDEPCLRFVAAPGSNWIYFSYESGGQTRIGVHSAKMEAIAQVFFPLDSEKSISLNLVPCAKHLGKGIEP